MGIRKKIPFLLASILSMCLIGKFGLYVNSPVPVYSASYISSKDDKAEKNKLEEHNTSTTRFIQNETSLVDSKSITKELKPENIKYKENIKLEKCPLIAPKLVGRLRIDEDPVNITELEEAFSEVERGGSYRPHDCVSRNRVAIIIPYRNRSIHLGIFLKHMHPILERQQLDYTIFVIEQAGSDDFNRAKLFNVGFLEAIQRYSYDCFVFHDVDLLPEDDTNMYTCPATPRHMSAAVNTFDYKLPYESIFGGVSALSEVDFRKVNGFSNMYWGWGGEDDDMSARISARVLAVVRYPLDIARYTMVRHTQALPSPTRMKLLNEAGSRFDTDGINSCEYKVLKIISNKLYTNITVDLMQPKL